MSRNCHSISLGTLRKLGDVILDDIRIKGTPAQKTNTYHCKWRCCIIKNANGLSIREWDSCCLQHFCCCMRRKNRGTNLWISDWISQGKERALGWEMYFEKHAVLPQLVICVFHESLVSNVVQNMLPQIIPQRSPRARRRCGDERGQRNDLWPRHARHGLWSQRSQNRYQDRQWQKSMKTTLAPFGGKRLYFVRFFLMREARRLRRTLIIDYRY